MSQGVPTTAQQREGRMGAYREEEERLARLRDAQADDLVNNPSGDWVDNAARDMERGNTSHALAQMQAKGEKTYGGYAGGAEDAVDRYQGMGAQGVNVNLSQANASRIQQQHSLGLMRGAALGQAPSQAEIMGRGMIDQSLAAQQSAAASSRGGALASAAATQNAANQGAATRQQGMNSLAALRADEMSKARAAYMSGTTGMRGMDTQQAFEQAKMNEQRQQYYEGQAHAVNQGQLNANLGFASDATQNRAVQRQEDADEWGKWAQAGAAVGSVALMALSDERAKYAYKPIQKREMGGPVTPGNPYLVGEAGPEIIVPGQGGTVIPNHALTTGGGAKIGEMAAMSPAMNLGAQMGQVGAEAGGAAGHAMSGTGGYHAGKAAEPKGEGLNLAGAGKALFEKAKEMGPKAGPPETGRSAMVDKAYADGQAMAERALAPRAQAPGGSIAGLGVQGVGGGDVNTAQDDLQQLSTGNFAYSDKDAKRDAFADGVRYAERHREQPKMAPKLPEYAKAYADKDMPAVRPMVVNGPQMAAKKDMATVASPTQYVSALPPPRPPPPAPVAPPAQVGNMAYSDDRTKLREAFTKGYEHRFNTEQATARGEEPPGVDVPYMPKGRRDEKNVLEVTGPKMASGKDGKAEGEGGIWLTPEKENKRVEGKDSMALSGMPTRHLLERESPFHSRVARDTRALYMPRLGLEVTHSTSPMKKYDPKANTLTPEDRAFSAVDYLPEPKFDERDPTLQVANQPREREFNDAFSDERAKLPNDGMGVMSERDFRQADDRMQEDANRRMKGAFYSYKENFTPPEQKPGEPNYGPMAQELEKNPITSTAVKKDANGMRMVDMNKMVKAQSASIANLQEQIDEMHGGMKANLARGPSVRNRDEDIEVDAAPNWLAKYMGDKPKGGPIDTKTQKQIDEMEGGMKANLARGPSVRKPDDDIEVDASPDWLTSYMKRRR